MVDEDKKDTPIIKIEPTSNGPQVRISQAEMTIEKAGRLGKRGYSVGGDADKGVTVVKKEK